MASSIEHITEIVEFYATHGVKLSCETFNIPTDTLNRYIRSYKKDVGPLDDMIGKLRDKFSDNQLSDLLSLDATKIKHNEVLYDFKGDTLTFLHITDTHIGSNAFDIERMKAIGQVAQQENVDLVFHTGDVTEGHPDRPGSVYEIAHFGYRAQRDAAVEALKWLEKPIYAIDGNHDSFFNDKIGAGAYIVEDICSRLPNAYYLGEGIGHFTDRKSGVKFELFHGKDRGAGYAISYRLQRIINAMTSENKPNILLTGHDHKAMYLPYRNIHSLAGGTVQRQTAWMSLQGLQAMEGFWLVKTCLGRSLTGQPEVKWFQQRFYPFYN